MSHKRSQNHIAESRIALPLTIVYGLAMSIFYGAWEQQLWMQTIVLAISTLLMAELNNSNSLIRIFSRMVSCSFLFMSVMAIFLLHSMQATIVQLCFIAFYLSLFKAYQNPRATGWVYYAFFAIGMATGVFCGQNIGAGNEKRTIQGFKAGIVLSLIYSSVMAFLAIVFTDPLIAFFSNETEVFVIAAPLVRITSAFGPVLGVVFVFQHFLRNVSDVRPTVVMSFAEVLSRGILPFAFSAWLGYYGIWWATPVGWTLSMLIGLLRFLSGKWKGKVNIQKEQPHRDDLTIPDTIR